MFQKIIFIFLLAKEFEFVEGTMLDGNILDDQPIRDVLLDLKKKMLIV